MTNTPDALFPSTYFGVPLLRLDRAANFVDAPVRGWGSVSRTKRMRGTWHFYVDDFKFNTLWTQPDQVALSQAVNCVEINFSIEDQSPFAVALYQIYRKRWVARYWQECGFRIFVDLNVPPIYEDLNLIGVPDGYSAWATSATDSRINDLARQYEIAKNHGKNGVNQTFLVYGGGKKVRAFCEKHDCVHVNDARNEARA